VLLEHRAPFSLGSLADAPDEYRIDNRLPLGDYLVK
jgi:hypothetical protein